MTGGVEEGDLLAVEVYAVGTDVLRDTARFAFDDVGLADVVQQRGLTVVDVSHHGHDGRPLHEILLFVAVFVDGFLNVHRDEFHLEPELLGDDHQRLRIESLVDGDHQSEVHAGRNDLRNRGVHHGGQFAHRNELGDFQDGLLHVCLFHRLVHAGAGIESLLLTVLGALVLSALGGEAGERILDLLRNLFVAHFGAYHGFRCVFLLPVFSGLGTALCGTAAGTLAVAGTLTGASARSCGLLLGHVHLVLADAFALLAPAAGRTEALDVHFSQHLRARQFGFVARTEDVVAVFGHALVVGLLLNDDLRFGSGRCRLGLRFGGRRCFRRFSDRFLGRALGGPGLLGRHRFLGLRHRGSRLGLRGGSGANLLLFRRCCGRSFGLLLRSCSRLRSCRFSASSGEVDLAYYFRAGTDLFPGTYNAAFDDHFLFELTVLGTGRILLVVQRYAFGFQVYPFADIDPVVGTPVAAELLFQDRIDVRFDRCIGRTLYVDTLLFEEIRNGGNAYFKLLCNL